jgi:diguanylate cyclase (GGDEF)-like protein
LKDSSNSNPEPIAEIALLKKRIQELEQKSSERIREEDERCARLLAVLHETSVELNRMKMELAERKMLEGALKHSGKRYRELSIIDDLTQLYNSRHFHHQLKIELDRSKRYEQPLTLLMFDLDDFKTFNDAYGHVEGDQVLMRLGQVVKRCLRHTDSAYRYGGEEFTILLPMTTGRDSIVTAERIRTEFKKEIFSPAPGQDVHVTVSIGLAQYKAQEDMKVFVNRVDQLMYQGKKNGKDRVCSES